MSKTYRKFNDRNNSGSSRKFNNEDDEDQYDNKSSYMKRRVNRRLNNAIRSKDITTLTELDEDYED